MARNARPMMMPGIAPAIKSLATDRLVIAEMTIMVLLGGMMMPTTELVALMAAEKGGG